MRNPLAEPYLLGVSGGAAVGAVVAVALGLSVTLVPIAAFGGAMVAVMLAFFVAHAAGTRGDARILLMAGVVVGAFANSVIMLVLGSAPSNVVRDAVWWMMGSVAAATWTDNAWLFASVRGPPLASASETAVSWLRIMHLLSNCYVP